MSSWRTGFSSPAVLRRTSRSAAFCTAPRTQGRHRSAPRDVEQTILYTGESLLGRTPVAETWISVEGTHVQCLHHSFDILIPFDHFQRVLSVTFDALTSKTSLLWHQYPLTLLPHKSDTWLGVAVFFRNCLSFDRIARRVCREAAMHCLNQERPDEQNGKQMHRPSTRPSNRRLPNAHSLSSHIECPATQFSQRRDEMASRRAHRR